MRCGNKVNSVQSLSDFIDVQASKYPFSGIAFIKRFFHHTTSGVQGLLAALYHECYEDLSFTVQSIYKHLSPASNKHIKWNNPQWKLKNYTEIYFL